jgi:catalase
MEPIWQKAPIAQRDAHAKAHGCVKAKFAVAEGLPPELAVGLFATPKSWDATVRFSNSERIPQSDRTKDGRGMAVKLDGIEQDFVMINHPVFFVRNAADYIDFVEGEKKNDHYSFFFGLRPPWRWRLHELWNGIHIKGHPLRSPLEERYFSMTPYKLGTRAIKFSARPCSSQISTVPAQGDNVLAAMLANGLRNGEGCFEFQVQLQGDPHAMPVEDPTLEWDEAKSPFRTVARITIPAQTPELQNCENLAFAPWHAQPDHRPLGGINRVRKEAYQRISTLRHDRNHVPN